MSAAPQAALKWRAVSFQLWCGVLAIAVTIALACGYRFGIVNQATYFVDALHRVHPELFRNDWFVMHTTSYHHAFSAFAALLLRADDTGVASCAVVHVAVMIAIVVGIFVTIATATERRAFAVFAIVATLLALTEERSLAGSYLWAGYLQPSLLATLGWIVALAAYAAGRPLVTGCALAAAGLVHANFLVLGLVLFALAELAVARDVRRVIYLVAPQLVALAIVAPDIFQSAHASDPDLALWVLVRFHAAGHYNPYAICMHLPTFAGWSVLAITVAPVAIAYGRAPAIRRLLALGAVISAVCIATPLLALVPSLLALVRLYVWRAAPFAVLIAQIVIVLAAVATIDDPACWRAHSGWRIALAAALAVWLA